MRAVVIHAANDLRIDERPEGVVGPGEVRVRLEAGGICGSDLHYFHEGPIGALCALAARRAGAAEVVSTDITDAPGPLLGKLGVDRFINVARDGAALASYGADKGTFDVLLEATASEAAIVAALDVVKPTGIIVQVGIGAKVTLPLGVIVAKELELRGTFRFHEEFALAVELIAKRLVDVRPLISATMPFTEARAAFDLASDRSRAMKVQLAFA